MKADLLLRLADYLEKDAVNPNGFKFDMWTWASSESDSDGFFTGNVKPEPNCGTSACAMGIAAISGIFKDEGLSYYVNIDGEFEFRFAEGWIGGFSAAQSLFEINDPQSRYLFDGDHMTGHPGELAVAKRIRAFVDSGGEMPEYTRE